MDRPYGGRWLHVAPMMEHTDRHLRTLLRLLSPELILWTEMVKATAIGRNRDPTWLGNVLDLPSVEAGFPTVLQFGGSDPAELGKAVELVRPWSYSEINLNCGCPAESIMTARIGQGYGLQLMKTPALARDCVAAMAEAAAPGQEISVKCRLGTHDTIEDALRDGDSFQKLLHFVDEVAASGRIKRFVVHARSGVLSGLSPRKNRQAPPLRYDLVHELQAARPNLQLVINGGITTTEAAEDQRRRGFEVMVGRWAANCPWDLASAAARKAGRWQIVQQYLLSCQQEFEKGRSHVGWMAKPLHSLVSNVHMAFKCREIMMERLGRAPQDGSFERLRSGVEEAFGCLPEEALAGEE